MGSYQSSIISNKLVSFPKILSSKSEDMILFSLRWNLWKRLDLWKALSVNFILTHTSDEKEKRSKIENR
jgi:hypothetical protein